MSSPIPTVATPEVAGVTVRRHVLDHEAARLAGLASRVGKRLSYWLREHQELPDAGWLESARWYGTTIQGLLKEQRLRSQLTKGVEVMSDAEYERELDEIIRARMMQMTDEEIARLRGAPAAPIATPRETATPRDAIADDLLAIRVADASLSVSPDVCSEQSSLPTPSSAVTGSTVGGVEPAQHDTLAADPCDDDEY
jgi:hypothetical protein